jgi:hypothetical protein
MGLYIDDTIGGFNTFLDKQKTATGRATITRIQFDHEYHVDYENIDVKDAAPLSLTTYGPRGSTALFDAVGMAVNNVGQYLSSLNEEQRPGHVIFVIITDGAENASNEFRIDKLKKMIKHQIEKYSWEFVYLGGGNIESQVDQGVNMGIPITNVYGYYMNNVPGVYNAVAAGTARRRQSLASNAPMTDSFLDDSESKSILSNK